MATLSRLFVLHHLRAEPNQCIVHWKNGRVVAKGAGLAYFYNPWSAAIAQVPAEDCETTFLLHERTKDFQPVSVQVTVTYRFADPELAATRFNFGISLRTGVWNEAPLERVGNLWSQLAQPPARAYLSQLTVVSALTEGPDAIRNAIAAALATEPALASAGLGLVQVQVIQITPNADLEKAIGTPTREALQQRADEAVFQRRALAVEKERAIKENELSTEIQLARQHEELIRRKGANQLLDAQQQAETEATRLDAELERQARSSAAYARDVLTKAEGDAGARARTAAADLAAEQGRVALWREAPPQVALGLAAMEFARHVQGIQHLNVTPDLVGRVLEQLALDKAGD